MYVALNIKMTIQWDSVDSLNNIHVFSYDIEIVMRESNDLCFISMCVR